MPRRVPAPSWVWLAAGVRYNTRGCESWRHSSPLLAAVPAFAAEFSQAEIIQRLKDEGATLTLNTGGEVVGVNLTSTWVKDADLALLSSLPSLESIDLSLTRITDIGLEHLKPLTKVRHLVLDHAEYFTDNGIAHFKAWRLETLNLRGTKVTSRVFDHIKTLTTLRTLDISHTEVTDSGFEELAELTNLEQSRHRRQSHPRPRARLTQARAVSSATLT